MFTFPTVRHFARPTTLDSSPIRGWRRGLMRILAVLAVGAVVVGGSIATALPAQAAGLGSGVLSISKTTNVTAPQIAGSTFTYTIGFGCSSTTTGCVDAVLTDEIPAPLEIVGSPLVVGVGSSTSTVTGNLVEIAFGDPVANTTPSSTGLSDSTSGSVQITVRVPANLATSWDSATVVNTANLVAVNADPRTAQASVELRVPTEVSAAVSKQWMPATAEYAPGTLSEVQLRVSNTSNITATAVTINEPAAPGSADNPFNFYDLSSFGAVSFPEGADRIRIDALVGGSWQTGNSATTAALPTGVIAGAVEGLRFIFTSASGATIAADGAEGSVAITLAQRATNRSAPGAALAAGGTRNNAVQATVDTPEGSAISPEARDTQEIASLTASVAVTKSFTVTSMPAGEETLATIRARNTSTGPLDSFVISEPSAGNAFFSDSVLFDGFDSTVTQWPAGATDATVTWFVNMGTAPTTSTVTVGSGLPAAPALGLGQHVTGFAIEFTGTIEVGAAARLGVKVDTTSGAATNPNAATVHSNVVGAIGTNQSGSGSASTSAELEIWVPAIEVSLTKSIRPNAVYTGGMSVVELLATTPAATSTVRPDALVITEPAIAGTSEYWNAFTPVAIGVTAVPQGSVLTLEYFDGATWQTMAGSSGVVDATANAQIFSGNLSDLLPSGVSTNDVLGLRFSFTDADGFGVATTVKPTIVFEARSNLRDGSGSAATGVPADSATWAQYENCAAVLASGTLDSVTLTDDATSCSNATIIPTDGGAGVGPAPVLVGKSLDQATAHAQSRQEVGATLLWGVQVGGFDSVQVSDSPTPSTANVAATMFQTFDLKRIDPISPASDPLIRWDAVSAVELYSQSADAWVDVTAAACTTALACAGKFAGYTLTAAERADTIGVRLTFKERADRAAAIASSSDPLAPPAGTGVASLPAGTYGGASANGRIIHLDLELRNRVRDDSATSSPWVTALEQYNHADPGVVRNTVGVVASPTTGSVVSGSAFADITLVQTPPTVEATKSVAPTTLTIPRPDVAPADYPRATYTTSVRNTSPTNVWKLRLTDPSVCADIASCTFGADDNPFASASYDATRNPFERVNLTGITIATPSSAIVTGTDVHLWHRNAAGVLSTSGPFTKNAAEAFTAAQLTDVIGVTALFRGESADGGTIIPGARATVTLQTQLRETVRSTNAPIAAAIIANSVLVGVHDSVLFPAIYNQDVASSPLAIEEGYLDVATTKSLTPSSALIAAPNTQVQVNLRARSTGTIAPKIVTITDDSPTFWNAFTAVSANVPTMPTGADQVEIAAKIGGVWISDGPTTRALASLPASASLAAIEGVRATFTRVDGAIFDGVNNVVNLRIVASLRTELRDGTGAVTASNHPTPMPGETLAGQVSNVETAMATHDELSDTATANAAFQVNPGSVTVSVEKTSIGQTAAGKEIPFSLRIRNTGTGYLVNPVITDQLPADGTLRFVPADVPIYSTTAGGTLTTDAAQITRSFDPATGRISFTFPNGAQLAPGETYTVTLRLEVAPGLPAATVGLNGLEFTNDRQLTACTALNNANGRTAVLNGNTCATDNIVTVLSIGSFSAFKGVRSTEQTATNTTNPALACTPAPDGYYRYPCAADTAIGATDEWKLQLVNGGTIGATTLQAIDVFPHSGDVGVVDPSPRGSAYAPRFNGDVSFTSSIPGVGFAWYFTKDAAVCTDDLYPSAPACSPSSWQPSAALSPGTAGDVTGIKVEFDFSGLLQATLPPASVLTVNYTSTNVPSLTTGDGRAPVSVPFENVRAWNSFGYYPTYISGVNPSSPEEPIKAGVGLFSGSLDVTKVITGTEASRAPTTITGSVACTIEGAPVAMGSFGAVTLDAATNYTARIDGIPQGSSCVVTEDGILGWFGEQERNGAQTLQIVAATTASDEVPSDQRATLINTYSPALLAFTGAQGMSALLSVGIAALIFGAALMFVRRRRA